MILLRLQEQGVVINDSTSDWLTDYVIDFDWELSLRGGGGGYLSYACSGRGRCTTVGRQVSRLV